MNVTVTQPEREYVLRTTDEETVRLGFQHRVWLELAAGSWERGGFAPGQTLLDVGCGPGYTSIDLAHLAGPSGKVIAIDESPRFIEHLKKTSSALGLSNINAIVGDVQAMKVEPRSIDGAYARWVLCFVERPEDVVQRVAKALRPGGTFVVQDYSDYLGVCLIPPSDIMTRVAQAVFESWKIRGGDPTVAKRVPDMMKRFGLEVVDVRPIVRTARPGSALWNWPTTFFRNYLPVLESMNLLSADECDAWREEWSRYARDPASRFHTPPMLEVIGVKR